MEKKDYYEVLGIDTNATQSEIKKAYRTLSMKWHPDRNKQSDESTKKFQNINSAYDTLSDPSKKKQYDMSVKFNNVFNPDDLINMFFNVGNENPVSSGFNPFSMHGGASVNGPNIHFFKNSFENISKHLVKPPSINKNLTITLEQSYNGCSIPIKIDRFILLQNIKNNESKTIYVNIPKGIDNNEIIIIKEKGDINQNVKGDVKITINIDNNTVFKRDGLNLIYHKNITLKESLCGFSFCLKVLNNNTFKINNSDKIINSGYQKCIQNYGMKRNNITGDLIIIFHVNFPDKIDNVTRNKLRELL